MWRALFLREAVQRLFSARAAWLWLLLEPVFHIAFMMFLFSTVRMRVVGGIETWLWLMSGMLTFFMFRRSAQQGMNAITANKALFAYRQVKPVDTVLVRAFLEGFLMLLVVAIFFTAALLAGGDLILAEPLTVIGAMLAIWLLGVGFGLMSSVVTEVFPELGKIINMLMTPLYFISGVIFPLNHVPQPYREWLLYNPLAHCLESARLGFAPYYEALPETSLSYAYGFALLMLFMGLLLHVRYSERLVAQ